MAKYAVVKINGHQYMVEEGQELLVSKLTDPKKVESEVLLVVDGEDVKLGTPVLKDAKVNLKVVTEMEKGEKVEVKKYKAKSRYRKHIGFRPQYSRLSVEKIA